MWDNAACDGDPDSPTEAAMKFSGIAANPEGSRWSHPCVTSNQNPPTSFFVETREQLSETHYMVPTAKPPCMELTMFSEPSLGSGTEVNLRGSHAEDECMHGTCSQLQISLGHEGD